MKKIKWYVVGFTRLIDGRVVRYNQVLSEEWIESLSKERGITILGKILIQIGRKKVSNAANERLPF